MLTEKVGLHWLSKSSAVLAALAVSLACADVQANPPKPAATTVLPQTFYNAPSIPVTQTALRNAAGAEGICAGADLPV